MTQGFGEGYVVVTNKNKTPILKYNKCDLNPIQMLLVSLGGKKKKHLIFNK
jgi:hypothetical protein